jgi:hypothetical protein
VIQKIRPHIEGLVISEEVRGMHNGWPHVALRQDCPQQIIHFLADTHLNLPGPRVVGLSFSNAQERTNCLAADSGIRISEPSIQDRGRIGFPDAPEGACGHPTDPWRLSPVLYNAHKSSSRPLGKPPALRKRKGGENPQILGLIPEHNSFQTVHGV